jgi:choline dehydrogenase-like flavoprotein
LFATTDPTLPAPDLQFQCVNFSRDPASGQPYREAGCTILFNVCRPKSRGEIRLQFTDRPEPAIHPNYLSDRDDVSRMLAGYEVACRIAEAGAVQLADCRARPPARRPLVARRYRKLPAKRGEHDVPSVRGMPHGRG